MKLGVFTASAALLVTVALSTSLTAQWPAFVRQDTPRTSTGQPNLEAPPPRLSDGRVDFSGTWESRQPPSGRLGGPMVPNVNPASDPPLANFANIGQNFKPGLPFTPWAADLRTRRMATNSKENPDAHCLPLGFMQLQVRVNWRLGVDEELIEFICQENNLSIKHMD